MEIRPRGAADAPAMWRIKAAGLPGTGPITEDALVEMLGYAELAIGAFDGELLGFVLCLPPGTQYGSLNYAWFNANFDEFLYVDRIAVAPDHRDRGIGSELYRYITEYSNIPIAAEVSLDPPNLASMRFHARHGFEKIGELQHADYAVNLMWRAEGSLAVVRQRLLALSNAAAESDDPLSWFETLYASSEDHEEIPWARMEPHPELVEHVQDRTPGSALVIGCGLGDDAEFLAGAGWDVVAFDLAESCIDWCRRRFPDSAVDYRVANLLELPSDWRFDLVVEIHILQAMPEAIRARAIGCIPPLVAEGGALLCVGRLAGVREQSEPAPPWPLEEAWLKSGFDSLESVSFRHFVNSETPGVDRYVGVWKR